jgi:uncharacterized membrane protein YgaE (UPF0421/DUF939 family)
MTLSEVRREGSRRLSRLSGLHYAARVVVSSAIVWFLLARLAHVDPVWGLISAVVVTDLKAQSAWTNFVSRMLNTLIGCLLGLLFLQLFGSSAWVVIAAMAVTVIISTDLVRVPVSWRIAPITAAIVMTPAYYTHSGHAALTIALERTGSVLVGSAVAVGVSHTAALLGLARRAGEGVAKNGVQKNGPAKDR